MKKLQLKGLLFVTAALVLGLMLAGCGGEIVGSAGDLVGTWEASPLPVPEVGSTGTYVPRSFQFDATTFTGYVKTADATKSSGTVSTDSVTGTYTISGNDKAGTVVFTSSKGYEWTAAYTIADKVLSLTGSDSIVLAKGVGSNSAVPAAEAAVFTNASTLIKK
ncbi:hypothetical protein FACS189444_1170 [Spirochaetia bacterium]|nr:hypothetical protein FACS189444_1170 [Spirochaetia bacterium]